MKAYKIGRPTKEPTFAMADLEGGWGGGGRNPPLESIFFLFFVYSTST